MTAAITKTIWENLNYGRHRGPGRLGHVHHSGCRRTTGRTSTGQTVLPLRTAGTTQEWDAQERRNHVVRITRLLGVRGGGAEYRLRRTFRQHPAADSGNSTDGHGTGTRSSPNCRKSPYPTTPRKILWELMNNWTDLESLLVRHGDIYPLIDKVRRIRNDVTHGTGTFTRSRKSYVNAMISISLLGMAIRSARAEEDRRREAGNGVGHGTLQRHLDLR